MKDLKEIILEEIKKNIKFPHHAHVSGIANLSTGEEENHITGYGKTKKDSKSASLATHRVLAHGSAAKHYEGHPVDKHDEADVEAHENSKYDTHYRVSQKAHDHMKKHASEVGEASHRGRDGYELTGHAIKDLHFDHKKNTISHKSEH